MWVFSGVQRKHGGMHYYIGAVYVGRVLKIRNQYWCLDTRSELVENPHETFGEALKELHRLLNSPSPNGETS